MTRDLTVLKERLEALDGSRRTNVGRAAVRLDDMRGLFEMPRDLKSARADGSVSVAEFNALVDDVHAVHAALRVLVNALRGRRGR